MNQILLVYCGLIAGELFLLLGDSIMRIHQSMTLKETLF